MSLWMQPDFLPTDPGDNDGIFIQHDDYDNQYGVRFDGNGGILGAYVESAGDTSIALARISHRVY